jgi:hypothetical protein
VNQPQNGTGAAAERGRWLAELAQAVDEAQRLAKMLRASEADCLAAKEIYDRLEAVRIEVDSLRRGSWIVRRKEIDPLRTGLFPWNRRQATILPKE